MRVSLCLLLLFTAATASAEMYTWKDSRGTVFYTNSIHEIPARYLRKARLFDVATGKKGGLATAQPPAAPQAPAQAAASPAPVQVQAAATPPPAAVAPAPTPPSTPPPNPSAAAAAVNQPPAAEVGQTPADAGVGVPRVDANEFAKRRAQRRRARVLE